MTDYKVKKTEADWRAQLDPMQFEVARHAETERQFSGKYWDHWSAGNYNCVGCHFHGGGGIGPPLMDDAWAYGSNPEQVFASIVQGRPNGMPSFRQKIPDYQVWQLVAYVRSMSGLVNKNAAPGRSDEMNTKTPENSVPTQPPRKLPRAELPR